MNIGFDAKRYYFNQTGLGNYSRNLVNTFIRQFPEHNYFLFSPKAPKATSSHYSHVHTILPVRIIDKLMPSFWRSRHCIKDIIKHVQLYHGLSNELPFGIHRSQLTTLVSIHDLIFEKFPNHYSRTDVAIYRKKFRYACKVADCIIATSECTKKDIIELYGIEHEKIKVCYQACDARFKVNTNQAALESVRQKFQLPQRYILYVGSVIERKNLLNIVKALELLPDKKLGLVVVGKGANYAATVKQYLQQKKLNHRVLWLEDKHNTQQIQSDLPAIYQMALALVYPSFYEGFGIPVLEAMKCNTAVITSRHSSMEEVCGDAALYVNPELAEEIADSISLLNNDEKTLRYLIEKGQCRAMLFSNEKHASQLMSIYHSLTNK